MTAGQLLARRAYVFRWRPTPAAPLTVLLPEMFSPEAAKRRLRSGCDSSSCWADASAFTEAGRDLNLTLLNSKRHRHRCVRVCACLCASPLESSSLMYLVSLKGIICTRGGAAVFFFFFATPPPPRSPSLSLWPSHPTQIWL